MSKHTPGQTEYNFGISGLELMLYKRSENEPFVEIPYDEAARRILTAPETAAERDRLRALNAELLAALKHVLPHVGVGYSGVQLESVLAPIRATITKAKGGAA